VIFRRANSRWTAARAVPLVVLALVLAGCGQAALLLEVGDCFDDPPGLVDTVTNVDVIDCADAHDNEVYVVVDFPDEGGYPGDDAVREFADETCIREFEAFVGFDYLQSELDLGYFWPTDESWDAGDRAVQCFVYELDGSQATGSLRNAAR